MGARLADWQARLETLIAERSAMPFVWGHNDCCLWAADAVLAMTGKDHADTLRGAYSTRRGAASVLRLVGGLEGAANRAGPEIAPLCAGPGDVGLVSSDGERDALAVCAGEVWLAVSAGGLGRLPLTTARKAWRVA